MNKHDYPVHARFRNLLEATNQLDGALSLPQALESAPRAMAQLVGAVSGLILVGDPGAGRSGLVGTYAADDGERLQALRALADQTVQSGQPVLTGIERTEGTLPESSSAMGSQSATVCVPLRIRNRVVGAACIDGRHDGGGFSREDLAVLEIIGSHAALAIENARLEETLRDAGKEKSDFLSLVTHELRLPLTSIKGYTDLMGREMVGPLNDQQRKFVAVVQRNVGRMSGLIDYLADINRLESKRLKLELEELALSDLVAEVAEQFRGVVEDKGQSLYIAVEGDLPPIVADRARLAQVLTILIGNAHKYTPEGGTIRIDGRVVGTTVHVAVSDTGVGILSEDQVQLFSPFFRSADPAVREQVGWGLGLALARMVVEAQGGSISCESAHGVGSTFTFSVPTATWAAGEPNAKMGA